jgi:hypothetical protein
MISQRERIEQLLRERVCRVCVSRLADGSCGLQQPAVCPILPRLPELMKIVRTTHSEAIGPYLDAVRSVICDQCLMGSAEHCLPREHLECALDLYLPLIVDAIEEGLGITPKARDRMNPQKEV